MTSETGFQKELLDDWKRDGAHGYKASNRHLTGVPDLVVQPSYSDGFFSNPRITMECKIMYFDEGKTYETKALTTPQANHLRALHASKGVGVWVIGYAFRHQQRWGLVLLHVEHGAKFTLTQGIVDDFSYPGHYPRPKGCPWPVRQLTKDIYNAFSTPNLAGFANFPGAR
jgi:hypothetical protein